MLLRAAYMWQSPYWETASAWDGTDFSCVFFGMYSWPWTTDLTDNVKKSVHDLEWKFVCYVDYIIGDIHIPS